MRRRKPTVDCRNCTKSVPTITPAGTILPKGTWCWTKKFRVRQHHRRCESFTPNKGTGILAWVDIEAALAALDGKTFDNIKWPMRR